MYYTSNKRTSKILHKLFDNLTTKESENRKNWAKLNRMVMVYDYLILNNDEDSLTGRKLKVQINNLRKQIKDEKKIRSLYKKIDQLWVQQAYASREVYVKKWNNMIDLANELGIN